MIAAVAIVLLIVAAAFFGWQRYQAYSKEGVLCVIYAGTELRRVIVPDSANEVPVVCTKNSDERVVLIHTDTTRKAGESNIEYSTRMVEEARSAMRTGS